MSSLESHVSRLQVVLHAEEDLYLRMRSLLRREEGELIALDPKELDQTLAEKKALAEEGRLLEESRVVLTDALADELGIGERPIKLSLLIEALGSDAGDLPEIHGRLSALIGSNRSLLEANGLFANRSLERVQKTLRMLGQAVPEEVGYGPRSQRAKSTGRGRLIRAAI